MHHTKKIIPSEYTKQVKLQEIPDIRMRYQKSMHLLFCIKIWARERRLQNAYRFYSLNRGKTPYRNLMTAMAKLNNLKFELPSHPLHSANSETILHIKNEKKKAKQSLAPICLKTKDFGIDALRLYCSIPILELNVNS